MDKLKMQSLDMTGSNINKIAQLFPNCVTERLSKNGKPELAIDFEKLQAELSNEILAEGEERYQFTWPDKRVANRLANTPTTMTLRPCRKESVDFDNTQNLYIEGDNLDVLKVLRETYLGKVKMIYIDPPYNTGNDFVYNDDFAQSKEEFEQNSGFLDKDGNKTMNKMQRNTESNGRFHTDWLNMIYPRLKVARDLLADNGVVFISIDDNEVENLKKICCEIFGESSYITDFIWQKKTGASDAKGIATITEYIVVYCKKANNVDKLFTRNTESYDLNRYKYKDEFCIERGPYYIDNLDRGGLQYSDSLNYGIKCPDGTVTYPNGKLSYINEGWIWKWSKAKVEWALNNSFLEFRKSSNKESGWSVCYKNYLNVDNECKPIERAAPHKNLITDVLNANAASVMKTLFGNNKYFDYSKPVELIYTLINKVKNNDGFLILDFFSGSATTAHAVMKLNAEDGGNRKFIMVQLPELTDENSEAYKAGYKNICEIGKERIRRAGKKIMEEALSNSSKESAKLDIGFRVLKLDTSNMKDVYYEPSKFTEKDLFEDNIKEDRTSEDLLFQVMLDLGVQLSAKIETRQMAGKNVHFVDGNYLIACFDKDVNESTITEIAKQKPVYFVMRDASAANDNVIDNFEQIFRHYSPATTCRIL